MFVENNLGDISDYLKAAFTPGAMLSTISTNVFDIFKNLSGKSVVSAPAPVLQDFSANVPLPSLNIEGDNSDILTIKRNPGKVATIVDDGSKTGKNPWYEDKNTLLIVGGIAFTLAGLYVLRGKK